MVFIVGDTRGGVLLSRLEEMAGGLGRTVSVSRSRAQGGRSPRLRIQESPGKQREHGAEASSPPPELLWNQTGLQGRQVKTPQLWLNLKIDKFPKAKTWQPTTMKDPNLISYPPGSCGYSFIREHTLQL